MPAMCTRLHVSTTVAIAARYLTLVANELLTARVLPPNGRATELGSPNIKYKGALAHFGCISTKNVGMQ